MKQMTVPASARARILPFLDAFWAAPNDADIEVRAGSTEGGEPAVLIAISGAGEHAFTSAEARKVADVFEEIMRAHPNEPEAATLPNIIMGLRAGSDHADKSAHRGHRDA